jgi:hypothetical protein
MLEEPGSGSDRSEMVMHIVEVQGLGARGPGAVRSPGAGWWVSAGAGAAAFWLANLAVSLTGVAADYRSALSIPYVPMLVEAAVGGLLVAGAVAFLLARFADHVPGRGPLRKATALAVAAGVLFTVVFGVPTLLRSDVSDPGHWVLVGAVINVIRFLALGLAVGLVGRARTTRDDRQHEAERRHPRS